MRERDSCLFLHISLYVYVYMKKSLYGTVFFDTSHNECLEAVGRTHLRVGWTSAHASSEDRETHTRTLCLRR